MTQVPHTNTFSYMNRDLDNKVGIPSPSQVVIIDIEASSLRGVSGDTYDAALLSYPVEIAIALDNGGSQAYLIRPEPGWQDWNSEPSDEDIGAIHRISRTRLFEEGRNSRFVAEWLNEQVDGKIAMCDSPNARADLFWLDRLYEASGVERGFDVFYLYDFIALEDPDFDMAYEQAGIADETEHRAERDATEIMRLYCEFYSIKANKEFSASPSTPTL